MISLIAMAAPTAPAAPSVSMATAKPPASAKIPVWSSALTMMLPALAVTTLPSSKRASTVLLTVWTATDPAPANVPVIAAAAPMA